MAEVKSNTVTVDIDAVLNDLAAQCEARAQDLDEFYRRYCVGPIDQDSISIKGQILAWREAAAMIHRRKMVG